MLLEFSLFHRFISEESNRTTKGLRGLRGLQIEGFWPMGCAKEQAWA
jgi:hypothetical protein